MSDLFYRLRLPALGRIGVGLLATSFILAITPPAQAEPSKGEIADEIAGWLSIKTGVPRRSVEIDDLGYKIFSDPTTGTGRISAGGNWHITDNLYTVIEAPEKGGENPLALELRVSERDLAYIAELTGAELPVFNGPTAILSYEAGTTIWFRAELTYKEYYDFFTFDPEVRTTPPKGIALSANDPLLLSDPDLQARAEVVRTRYRSLSDAVSNADPNTVYRASVGTYTVTAPEGGILVHRPAGECINATSKEGNPAKVEAPIQARGWAIVRIGDDSAGETIGITVKSSC